jgi:hypothetical protein
MTNLQKIQKIRKALDKLIKDLKKKDNFAWAVVSEADTHLARAERLIID